MLSPTKTELENPLKEKVSSEYLEAKDIKVCEIGVDMPASVAFNAEFNDHDGPSFCYALVQQDGQCRISTTAKRLSCSFKISLTGRDRCGSGSAN